MDAKKTHLAKAISRSGKFRIAVISRALEVNRSNIYVQNRKIDDVKKQIKREDDERVLPLIKIIIDKRPSYGYRRVTALLRFQGETINPKRV